MSNSGIIKTLINISNKDPIYYPFENYANFSADATANPVTIVKNTDCNFLLEILHVFAYLSTDATVATRDVYIRVIDEDENNIGSIQVLKLTASSWQFATCLPNSEGTITSPNYGYILPLPKRFIQSGQTLQYGTVNGQAGDTLHIYAEWRKVPCHVRAQ